MLERISSVLSWRRALLAGVLVAGSIGMAGCAEEVVAGPRYRGEYIAVEPPVAQAEVIGVAPHPGWIRQPGYWEWRGGRHEWVAGAWVEPRAGYRWEPHAWVHEGKGWRLREGYWVKS